MSSNNNSGRFSAWVKRNGWSNPRNINEYDWQRSKESRVNHSTGRAWGVTYLESTFNEGEKKHLVSIGLTENNLLVLLNEMRVLRGVSAILPKDDKHHCCHYGDSCDETMPL